MFYSQSGQDKWVDEFYKSKKNGFFIEVGAHNGFSSSNTYYLEKELNWNGICIEANKSLFNELIRNRNSKNINIAVSSYDGYCKFSNDKISNDENGDSIKCNTLNQILLDAGSKQNIDYLSLDIEGHESVALESIDFNYWNIGLITVEHNLYCTGNTEKNKIYNILNKNNFTRVRENVLCLDTNPEWHNQPYEDWYINNNLLQEKPTYHVITPLARYQNINKLINMLEDKNIQWHVITDNDSKFRLQFDQDWIHHYICPNKENKFFERCNYSINWFIDNYELDPDAMYCILNDDDAYEPEFFNKITYELKNESIDSEYKNVIICSMERGNNIPHDAVDIRRHPTHKLWATNESMEVGGVSIEQIILKGEILKNYRIPLMPAGDGDFILNVLNSNKCFMMPNINVWFNYFEPGRWN
jgi:FkbM family methyltransferase